MGFYIIDVAMFEFSSIHLIVQILWGALAMLLLLIGADLLGRYLQADKRTRTDASYMTFFIIAAACLGYGIYLFSAIMVEFYTDKISDFPDWIGAFRIFMIPMIIVPIAWVCSRIVFPKKIFTYLFTGVGAIVILYLFIIMIIEATRPDLIAFGGAWTIPVWILIGVYAIFDFMGVVYILGVKLSPQKEVRRKVFFGLIGLVIAGIGEVFQYLARQTPDNGGENIYYVIGAIIEIFGFLIMRQAFLSIPSYDEFEWRNGMIELHVIIADTGISLYYHKFSQVDPASLKGDLRVTASIPEDEARPNTDLVAGGLVGIKGMLSEISGEKGKLENIEIGEKSLIFKQGKVAMALLLADENLGVYHSMLDEVVRLIEETHPDLAHFNGDTRKLHIEPIVNEVFALKKEKNQKQK